MSKEVRKIGIYMRVGNKIYTDPSEFKKDTERERVVAKMTPEQIAFCEKMKSELENKALV